MNLYSILGVPKSADADAIREAYKKLVRTAHPDKGGNEEKFKEIQKAYDVLRDEKKRRFYDHTGDIPGEGGLQSENMPPHPFAGGGGIPFDMGGLFGMFNRGGGGSRKRQGKAPPRVSELPLSLRDFYHGRSFKIQLERQRFCKDCKGEGSMSTRVCEPCNGIGSKVQHVQMGPFMMQNQVPCEVCNGAGKNKGENCWTCKGNGMSKEEKSLEVKIQPGMMPGHMIVFPGESSDSPDFTEAGDVVIHLQAADEATHWVREGEDLHTTVLIQYHEALTGCSKAVANHPGYETPLVITVKPGVRHGDVIRFKGYGMPKRNSQEKGDAVITVQLTPASPFEHMTLLAESQRLKELFRYQPYEFTGREHVVS